MYVNIVCYNDSSSLKKSCLNAHRTCSSHATVGHDDEAGWNDAQWGLWEKAGAHVGYSWSLCGGVGRWTLWAHCCGALSVSLVSLTHGQQSYSRRNGLSFTAPLLVQGPSLISRCAAESLTNVQYVPCCMCLHKIMRTRRESMLFMKNFINSKCIAFPPT